MGSRDFPGPVRSMTPAFLHGFDGKRRPSRVVYFTPEQRADAERVARVIHGRATTDVVEAQAKHWNVLVLTTARKPAFRASYGATPGAAVGFVFAGDPALLLRKPPFGRFASEVAR